MKQLYLVIILQCILTVCFGQTYQYHPFPTTSAIWKYEETDFDGNHLSWWFDSYVVGGSGIIDTLTSGHGSYYEENKRIYYRTQGSPSPSYTCLFDFNLTVGDSVLSYWTTDDYQYVISDDSVSVDYGNRRVLQIGEHTTWVEGIGNVASAQWVFEQTTIGAIWEPSNLICLIADGNSILDPNCGTVHVAEMQRESGLIYPNPSNGIINYDRQFDSVTIFNAIGREVTNQVPVDKHSRTLNLTGLMDGIFLCQFTEADGTVNTFKLLKN